MTTLIQGLFALFLCFFALHVLVEFRTVRRLRRCPPELSQSRPVSGESDSRREWPAVTVLLPVYNEAAVIERLIDAVAALDYPEGRLEVLVLDDSTDHSTDLARVRVDAHAACGLNIRLIRRADRTGFKAGNLRHGVGEARGDFLAIFDADFLPPADFLLRTMPCFDDARVGFLQTAIAYLNRDATFLTRFQAMIMGHQQFVTQGLSRDGLMGSLSGSACIWRRSCVESLGGWTADTITEDVDLGYRAQFSSWRYAYVPDVVCLSELPERLADVRVQRDRWARGLVQNAFRHGAGTGVQRDLQAHELAMAWLRALKLRA